MLFYMLHFLICIPHRLTINLKFCSKFLNYFSKVRNLINWANGLRAAMLTEEKVRDAASAQILKAEHEATKAEIETRENSFKVVIELGEALVQGGHYAAPVSIRLLVFHSTCPIFIRIVTVFIFNVSFLRKFKKSLIICWKKGNRCIRLGSVKKFIWINLLTYTFSYVTPNR